MKRKKKENGSSDGPADWELSFSCLSIILVSFFCLLNSYSDMEQGKMIEISRSFKGAVALLPGGLSLELGTELVLYSPDRSSRGRMALRREVRRSIRNIEAQIKETGLQDQVTVVGSEEGVQFTLRDAILFDPGSAVLKRSAYKVIDIIANTIRKSKVLAVVEGHTDSTPIHTALFPSNWELSAMRAASVVRYMQTRFRIPPYQLEARGYGPFHPVADNRTPEGRARNRRVEVKLTALPKGRHGEE